MPKVDMNVPLRPKCSLDIVDEKDFNTWISAQEFLERDEELAKSDEQRASGMPITAEHNDLDAMIDKS